MSVPKGQHYVTEAYLHGFASGTGKKARLFVYERGREPYQQHPTNVAKQNYYYSFVGENGKLDHSVEEFLGKIESAAMPVITKLASANVQLTWEERAWLASFIAMHEVRVPWMREGFDAMTEQLMKHVMRVIVSAPGQLEKTLEQMKADGKEVEAESARDIREMVEKDQYVVQIDPAYSLGLMIQMMPEMTARYSEMKWMIARTIVDRPYITCDNPVVRVNPKITKSFYDSHGIDNTNTEIRFPLNKMTAVVIMNDMERVGQWHALMKSGRSEEARKLRGTVPVTSFMEAPEQMVQAINIGTARYARRFVYTNARNHEIPAMLGRKPGGLRPTATPPVK